MVIDGYFNPPHNFIITVAKFCSQIYDVFSFVTDCWNFQFSGLHNGKTKFLIKIVIILFMPQFLNFFSLYDQQGKLISREEFDKIMAKEKTEQIEVRKFELYNTNWVDCFANRWVSFRELLSWRDLLFSFIWFALTWVLESEMQSSHFHCSGLLYNLPGARLFGWGLLFY